TRPAQLHRMTPSKKFPTHRPERRATIKFRHATMGDRPTVYLSPQLLFWFGGRHLSAVKVSGGGPNHIFNTQWRENTPCIWCLSRAKHYILYHFVRCLALPFKLLVFSVLGVRRPVYYVNSALFSTRTAGSSSYLVISFCLAAPHRRSL